MDTSGFQQEVTYEQIKKRELEQTGITVSSLYLAQVKQGCGITKCDNYNKPSQRTQDSHIILLKRKWQLYSRYNHAQVLDSIPYYIHDWRIR